MGNARFLYNNLIRENSIAVTGSLRAYLTTWGGTECGPVGILTSAIKSGSGSATMAVTGTYTITYDMEFVIEIDSVAVGVSVGEATYKIGYGGSWIYTGVTTSISPVQIGSTGIYIAFTAGAGDDFALGDTWYFKGVHTYGYNNLVDGSRDNRFRTSSVAATTYISADLDSAQEIKVLVIADHNIPASATITLYGAASGGGTTFTQAVTWSSGTIVQYLSSAQTYRAWSLKIYDIVPLVSYYEIGEWYLGSYLELSRNYAEGWEEEIEFLQEANRTPYGVGYNRFYNTRKRISHTYELMTATDVTNVETMISAITSKTDGTNKAFWYNQDSDSASNTHMVRLNALPVSHRTKTYYDIEFEMEEVPTSV